MNLFFTTKILKPHCENDLLIYQFQKRGYDRSLIKQQINKANLQKSEQLLKEKNKEITTNIPLLLKYNRTLPKIKKML